MSRHVLRQARRQGGLQGARHDQERQDGPGWLKDSDKEVTALAVASVQDKSILVRLSIWPEPLDAASVVLHGTTTLSNKLCRVLHSFHSPQRTQPVSGPSWKQALVGETEKLWEVRRG